MVDKDSKDVSQMVLAAKNGNWDEVFAILSNKPNLVNCIPEDRAWAALHQATWWKNENAVKRLLKCPACDSEVKTKQDRAGEVGPGKTALWIAQNFRRSAQISNILENYLKEERKHRFEGDIPTYVTEDRGERMDMEGLPLLLLTLANYKKTFHPSQISPGHAFNATMKEIFGYEDTGTHWRDAKEKICFSIGAFDRESAKDLLKQKTESDFFAKMVNLYTGNHLYRQVNESLRREGLEKYKAKAEDLALGPYTLFLDVLLFYWPALPGVATTTYRGTHLQDADLQKYKVGIKFIWLNFVSSSTTKEGSFSGNVKFEIDNSMPDASLWRPRSIKKFSVYPNEDEALYPAGAEFEVTSKTYSGSVTTIKLKLLNPLQ